ncbi:hypothetical protein ADIS_2874 [Lunatimonas lonarensis]|uniref:Uncharacterized protein n=1 Tax=Lunatimonas lonarensis TaxID=1232681 RepID=R7ZQY4_9BACT|nr:hypothetical protein ADIS_2874 [Lunatimonas lonarensis]
MKIPLLKKSAPVNLSEKVGESLETAIPHLFSDALMPNRIDRSS